MRNILQWLVVCTCVSCATVASECERYVIAQNACAETVEQLEPVSAEIVCTSLRGLAEPALRDELACLADAYETADCTDDETYAATWFDVCAEP